MSSNIEQHKSGFASSLLGEQTFPPRMWNIKKEESVWKEENFLPSITVIVEKKEAQPAPPE